MAYLRGTVLEYGGASLPDVQCQDAPRLATQCLGHYPAQASNSTRGIHFYEFRTCRI